MKIKVCVANYGHFQIQYLNKMHEEFSKYKKYTVDFTVYSNVSVQQKHILYPDGIGTNLPFACRKHMADDLEKYDLFLYNENDHLITEDNIDAFLEHSSKLEDNQVSGFIRYENRNDKKILLDLNPGREFINGTPTLIKNRYEENFSLHNEHQGCWLLTKNQLKKVIDSGNFIMDSPTQETIDIETGMVYCSLEQGASHPYTQCSLEKVFPKDINILRRLLILHLPLKYSLMDLWLSHGITIEELQNYGK